LLREFALYDAPTPVAADPVDRETPADEAVQPEPLFDVFVEPAADIPSVEPVADVAFQDAAPSLDDDLLDGLDDALLQAAPDVAAVEPETPEPDFSLDAEPVADGGEQTSYGEPDPAEADYDGDLTQSGWRVEPAAYVAPTAAIPEPEEVAEEQVFVEPVPVAEPEDAAPAIIAATEAFSEPAAHAAAEPQFIGLQPAGYADDLSFDASDLAHELELSLGGEADVADRPSRDAGPALSADSAADVAAAFDAYAPADPLIEALPDHEIPMSAEGGGDVWLPAPTISVADAPFDAVEPDVFPSSGADAPLDAIESVVWPGDHAYHVPSQYDLSEPVQVRGSDDHDDLLAEVERFPVPEPKAGSRWMDGAAAVASAAALQAVARFGRATPLPPAMAGSSNEVKAPAAAFVDERHVRVEPEVTTAAPAAIAVEEPDFEDFEIEIGDLDLDFDLEGPDPQEVVATDVTEEPEAEPVAVATAALTPPVEEVETAALPFDPSLISDTDYGLAPVAELNVPHLPVHEKEKPPALQPDYDLDIDAELAHIFGAATPAAEQPAAQAIPATVHGSDRRTIDFSDADEFDKALEEDIRRSMREAVPHAIAVDASQTDDFVDGDGDDRRSRRGLLLAACAAGLVVLGGIGAYAWIYSDGGAAVIGEPRVILADKNPVKVVPEEKGGRTVPNQDKAVYDRVAGASEATPRQEQLVTTTEEPVDVVQRTLTPEALPSDGLDAAESDEARLLPGVDEPELAAAEDEKTPVISPRKVRTMIVKPDGTLVAREETVSEPATGEVAGAAEADAVT
ncbi:hypothetical protein LXM94_20940, partial [Rhizobium sp. TRM95111]|uniref:hypothetical protein n=1 Tax=Rhizobium alarense TaxID=2846851 RepID=UPI001F37ADD0